jgi:hypothetical protein
MFMAEGKCEIFSTAALRALIAIRSARFSP